MTDAQIAATGAPTWEQTIMTAMAHYGMYVNDTDGINNIELEAESDISYTSLGGKSLLDDFIASHGGSYYSPLKRWILSGRAIPTNRLRVINPCFAQGTCPGTALTSHSSNIRARIASIPHRRSQRSAKRHVRYGHGVIAALSFARA